jgi:hypothetical protein
VNRPFWVLRGRQLLRIFVSSQVVQVAVGEDQHMSAAAYGMFTWTLRRMSKIIKGANMC